MHQSATSDKTQRLEWSNWARGDTFSFGLEDVAASEQDGYQAINMQVYNDGSLGVRPWFRKLAGDTTARSVAYFDASSGRLRLFNTISSVWRTIAASSWTSDTQAPADTGPVVALGQSRYYTGGRLVTPNTNGGLYTAGQVDLGSPYTSAPNLFEPAEGELYKNRLYVVSKPAATDTDEPNRIRYTNLGVLTSLPAANYFDIAPNQYDSTYVKHMWSTSDALLIARSDGLWYALSGEDAETGSLREISYGRLPESKLASCVRGNEVMFLAPNGKGITIWSPNGEDLKLDHIRPRKSVDHRDLTPISAEVGLLGGTVAFLYDRPASQYHGAGDWANGVYSIEHVNEVWNHHLLWGSDEKTGTQISGPGAGTYRVLNTFMVPQEDVLGVLVWNSGTGDLWTFVRDMTLDRPSADFDTYSGKGELVPTAFTQHVAAGQVRLRKVSAPDGGRLRIRRVYVDCRYWKDGTNYQTPAMTCVVNSAPGSQSATTTWSGAALADADELEGGSTRITFLLPETSFEDWNQVQLNGIQSMSIKRVTVEYEIIDAIDGA